MTVIDLRARNDATDKSPPETDSESENKMESEDVLVETTFD